MSPFAATTADKKMSAKIQPSSSSSKLGAAGLHSLGAPKSGNASTNVTAATSAASLKSKAPSSTQNNTEPEAEVPEDNPDDVFTSTVSFLSPDTVRWMNKRRPDAKNSMRGHVLPSRALQLREIFRGLDFDGSGNIDIDELTEAIEFVVKSTNSGSGNDEPLFKDPAKIVKFFAAMDTNGDGTVDFNEFLLAMTQQSEGNDSDEQTTRLQNAFFEFANQHRRQKINDFVQNPEFSDQEKYDEMKKLFNIKYFKDEEIITSVNDQLNKVKEDVKRQMKMIQNDHYLKQKKQEAVRAREAALFFEQKRQAGEANPFKLPFIPSIMAPSSNSEKEVTLMKAKLHRKEAEKRIRQRFAEFSLHDAHTFTPDVEKVNEQTRPENIRRIAKQEAFSIKNDKYLLKNIPAIVPPVPIRDRVIHSHHHKKSH